MVLALSDENYGPFTVDEPVDFGHRFDLPDKAVIGMISRIGTSILKLLPASVQSYLSTELVDVVVGRAQSLITHR